MTVGDAATLLLTAHGSVWIPAAAAYYKYGDRTEFFDKTLRGTQSTRETIRDRIAENLGNQLRPVIREAITTPVRAPNLNAAGTQYDEDLPEVTLGEPFRQAIRDFVSVDAGTLVDYRQIIRAIERWSKWAHRLSSCVLFLLVLATLIVFGAFLTPFFLNPASIAPWWILPVFLAPTIIIVVCVFVSLCQVHFRHGSIIDVRQRYDA